MKIRWGIVEQQVVVIKARFETDVRRMDSSTFGWLTALRWTCER